MRLRQLCTLATVLAQVGLCAPAWAQAVAPIPPAAAVSPTAGDAPLTADTLATAEKPAGFRYSIVREGLVDELSGTFLYVKASKEAKTTSAAPVPKDRTLLAKFVTGGTPEDLVKGAVVTVKFDPRGVVHPEIEIHSKPTLEVLDGAKVIDRGGNKLYVSTQDGNQRGFELQGGAAAWDTVVTNGKADDLKPGTAIRVEFDPSGRLPLQVTLLTPPKAEPAKGKGCGCKVAAGPSETPIGASTLGLALLGLWSWRRWAWRLRARISST